MAVVVKSTPPPPSTTLAANALLPQPNLVDRVITVGFVFALVAVGVQTVAHLANAFFFDYDIWNLDADQDGNALSWASAVATFAAALGAFLLGFFFSTPQRQVLALAAVLAFLSLDDVVAIHEELAFADYGVDIPDRMRRGFWPVLYLPLLVFVVVTLWQIALRARDRIRRTVRLALGLLGLALVAEAVAQLAWSGDRTGHHLVDDLEVALEEGAELGAWILIASALLASFCEAILRLRVPGDLPRQADGVSLPR